MTGKGWSRLLTKRQEIYLDSHLTCAVKSGTYDYSETTAKPELRGLIKEWYVLFGMTGDIQSGHRVATFPPTEEGKESAKKCADAIASAIRLTKGIQIRKEEG